MQQSKIRVAVAMSGGVDSSVAASLLLRQGYQVFGIFAKTWTPEPGDGTTCTTVADRRDALRVAAQIGIPLHTVDLEHEYRTGVIDHLFTGYARGETPNPDVLCNRIIKFGGLWRQAQVLGATRLATGHYARIEEEGRRKIADRACRLLRGIDTNKDQSYFLWDIPREVLPSVLFPIGGLTKPEVRQLAHKFGLPVASKKDSQGICFLGQTDLQTFLSLRIPDRPGPIRNYQTGRIIGQHQGVHRFTIGQRHGLGSLITSDRDQPKYVLALDPTHKTVWVGQVALLERIGLKVGKFNWLTERSIKEIGSLTNLTAQIRYRQPPVACTLTRLTESSGHVQFRQSVRAATVGQSIVFYDGDRLLGGGVIQSIDLPLTKQFSRDIASKTVAV